MTRTIAIYGAAGKMGTRISSKLADQGSRLLYVEANPTMEAVLRQRGQEPSPPDQAAETADIVVLAVPDIYIKAVSHEVVPLMRSGALLICLDPAAPVGGQLPARDDVAYFVTHPCHPPIIKHEETPEARADFFGGIAAQSIVCALMQGSENDYNLGVETARQMFSPVRRAHRITVEQMAILEPALTETIVLTTVLMLREALDRVIKAGVPAEAATDFFLGHIGINIATNFGFYDAPVSDGAKLAAARARDILFHSDWVKVLDWDNVVDQVQSIIKGTQE